MLIADDVHRAAAAFGRPAVCISVIREVLSKAVAVGERSFASHTLTISTTQGLKPCLQ